MDKVNIAAKIEVRLSDFVEDYRWTNRVETRAEIVTEALLEWAQRRGYVLESDRDEQLSSEDH